MSACPTTTTTGPAPPNAGQSPPAEAISAGVRTRHRPAAVPVQPRSRPPGRPICADARKTWTDGSGSSAGTSSESAKRGAEVEEALHVLLEDPRESGTQHRPQTGAGG